MTTEASDTKKHPLFSLLENAAAHWAGEVKGWGDAQSSDSIGILTNLSIAISLKRIADQGEPINVKAEAPPENAWLFRTDSRDLDQMDLYDLIEVSFPDSRPHAQWLLGDAIDWSHRPERILKPIFAAWRRVRR